MPPPVETPKSRRRDATEARDPRAARPAGRAGPARGRGVKQTARRTYRERRVFARPERAKHRAKLACASDWTRFEVFGSVSKTEARCLGGGFRRGNARAVRVRTKTSLGVLARGGDGGDAPPLSGERSREYGPPRLAWSASAMFALPVRVIAGGRTASGGGGVGQSRKGRRKYKTM